MSKKLVSVVVPSYNHERFIYKCLKSIKDQSYRPLEVVIVDDGSTDASPAIIKDFVQKNSSSDFKFQCYFKKNSGAHNAINFGIKKANAKIVTILNSDDEFHKDRIENLVKPIALGKTKLAMSIVSFVDDNSNPIPITDKRVSWYFPQISLRYFYPSLSMSLFVFPLHVTSGNLMFCKSLFTELKGFKNYRWAHDYDFVLRATQFTEPIIVSKKLMSYRIHSTNTINSIIKNKQQFDQEVRRILEDNLLIAARNYESKQSKNVFAATPFNWGEKFRQIYSQRGPFFAPASSFLQELSLSSLGTEKMNVFLPDFNLAATALQALPSYHNLHLSNFPQAYDSRIKNLKLLKTTKVNFQHKFIGSMVTASCEIDFPYDSSLALLGVFEGKRLSAILRFEKKIGKKLIFKGFSEKDLQKKGLTICWLDFDGQSFSCKWKSKNNFSFQGRSCKAKNAKAYVDTVTKSKHYLTVEGWGLIDGQLPEKIELYADNNKFDVLPILYPRPDLASLMHESKLNKYAGLRFFVPAELLGSKKNFSVKLVMHTNGQVLTVNRKINSNKVLIT